MPLWRRIQEISLARTTETADCRCVSSRCATDTTAQRGRPSAVRSIEAMSIRSPTSQEANAGEASRPLSFMASFIRSSAG